MNNADNIEKLNSLKIMMLTINFPLPALRKVDVRKGIFQMKTLVISKCPMDCEMQPRINLKMAFTKTNLNHYAIPPQQ